MSDWNTADKVLLCTALAFLSAVGFRMIFPDNIFVEGFLFVTEAAMVGGIADWFAVTALFRKPLGFPYHTAILPSRREEFISASVTMVKQEFFSRRAIFNKLGKLQLLPQLLEQLDKDDTRKFVIALILNEIKSFFANINKDIISRRIANELRRAVRDVPPKLLVNELGHWIRRSGKDKELFSNIAKRARQRAQTPEARQTLQRILERYAQNKTQSGGFTSLLKLTLAETIGLVNYAEAAELIQMQLLQFLDELSDDSPLQQLILRQCRETASSIADTNEFQDFVDDLQVDTVSKLPLEEIIVKTLVGIDRQLSSMRVDKLVNTVCADAQKPAVETDQLVVRKERTIGTVLAEILYVEYNHGLAILKTDGNVRKLVEKFIYDLVARTALHAQPLIGTIAQNVLENLTDEQLNKLVYDKAEPDFIWIRLNGSIVGSIVGLAIFLVIQFAG